MHPDWERQWILVCLGVLSVSTVIMGAAVAAIDLPSFVRSVEDSRSLLLALLKLGLFLGSGVCYLTVGMRARLAMFATDYDLAKQGLDRRRAVENTFRIMLLQLYLLAWVAMITALDTVLLEMLTAWLAAAENSQPMQK